MLAIYIRIDKNNHEDLIICLSEKNRTISFDGATTRD